MARKKWIIASTALVVAVAGGGLALTAQPAADGQGGQQQDERLPPDTAPVVKGDLSNSVQADGTLGHARQRKINAGTPGTLTKIAGEGDTLERDDRLYEVNGRAVRLMYGTSPMYRTMKAGDEGDDVRQLKRNLQALGYGAGLAMDDEFTSGTAAAVKRWQKDHGAERTGEVGKGDIAFAPGPLRVREASAATGDELAPGKPVLTVTGSERVVTFKLEVSEADIAKKGTEVTVRLPDGSTAKGKVSSVGKTAEEDQGEQGGGQDRTPKIKVTVTFDDPARAKGPDQSPVTVELVGETRRDVLSVPVNALLALPGGGFGVQVVEDGGGSRDGGSGGKVREVRVELGMFGEGRVEVSGGGLAEGMKVGVPKI
ncbi:efflux RND transporter periplasmic adaptor subunit [Streptomyces luteolus]|uniref:Peptidoglycan-binding protein n=1 Tax=Streptomyces luteolus TaxID=3043615 RepID=A0ABT6T1R5_9ACTN|nr:peptidoglycan-binding protein [Streptomyces sp. B-S-A12]MDI3421550.1 peptidoglycan-binding protein [Streptomyces sp. B-S-A12]